jgi:hypothetical protein
LTRFLHAKILSKPIAEHGFTLRSGKADHRVAKRNDVVRIAQRVHGREQALEIDSLGIEQRSVHIEKERPYVPVVAHDAVPLAG